MFGLMNRGLKWNQQNVATKIRWLVLHLLVETAICVTCMSSDVVHVDHLLVVLAGNLPVNLNLVAERQKLKQTPWIGGRQIIEFCLGDTMTVLFGCFG